jgi:hypothetical protein
MIKDILRSIDSLGVWGTLAILLFFMVFAYWNISVLFLDKNFQAHMSHLPLDDNKSEGENHE